MEPIDCQALLIRYSAAVSQIEHTDRQGRIDLLACVLMPGKELLAASLSEAERVGVGNVAYAMSRSDKTAKPAKRVIRWAA